ncbi:response regulator transcription factor [Sphingobium sp. EM0848]|uniref:response regulator n=1 Tax=Sphingobium sp. EM0848 TaxID=2743473 RepID=UPI00159C1014|nr:response regulator transcription factor [Sphingobium sp. EM0848]
MRILIVEDDIELAGTLREALRQRGVASDIAHSVQRAEDSLAVLDYAAVLLDLGLPDGDGQQLLGNMRSRRDGRPVIILTARGETRARIDGLNAGADDYLTKPFDVDELHARLMAVLRRQGGYQGTSIHCANLRVDLGAHAAFVDDSPLTLSSREMELLELLSRRSGRIVPKRLAEDHLFGLDGNLDSNAIEVYMHRLRRRLKAVSAKVVIETVRGVGYMLAARP